MTTTLTDRTEVRYLRERVVVRALTGERRAKREAMVLVPKWEVRDEHGMRPATGVVRIELEVRDERSRDPQRRH